MRRRASFSRVVREALLLACAVGAVQSLAAQDSAMRGDVQTLVSISATVHPNGGAEPPLPFPLLEQIERDRYLLRLETTAQPQTGPSLVLTFGFPTVAAYRTWAEAPETRRMLEALRTRVSQWQLTVSLQRSATASGSGGAR